MKKIVLMICGLLFGLVLPGCQSLTTESSQSAVQLELSEEGLLSDKEIIYRVLLNADLRIDGSDHCQNAGRSPTDQTLGAYLSGFLADLNDHDARNTVRVSSRAAKDEDYGAVWQVQFLITQNNDQTKVYWSAGFLFLIEQSSGTIIPESLSCIGSG